jgi:hypothetical protein
MNQVHLAISAMLLACCVAQAAWSDDPIDIGSRLELLVDDYLIDSMSGDAKLHLHKPEPKEVVLVTDEPWEGNTCAYYTIFQDDDLYRMYYRGSHYDVTQRRAAHPEVACYAESKDGIHWSKPELGLFEFQGSKRNNIVWDGVGTHDFTPFKDSNPACSEDARYKALGRGGGQYKRGLYAFKSPDGIRWTLMSQEPVITKGAFDSQNLAFWDPIRRLYVDFHRTFSAGVRDIMTCTSKDFLKWTDPVLLQYTGAPKEHLYTNAIRPYERAPHLYIGFPTRYLPKTQQVEPTFMTSRDGRRFHRWPEALIPITAPEDRDGNRSNYMTWGLVKLPRNDRQLSVYATEAYYTGADSRVRRFSYRVDGFVSVRATAAGGELLTKPIKFAGDKLVVNVATREKGSLRVELQDAGGKTIDGFSLAECMELRGDWVEQTVTWKQGGSLGPLAGKPVRLRFKLADADLFSFRVDN